MIKNLSVFLLAGVDTISHSITSILYYLHTQKDKRKILENELTKVINNDITLLTSEKVDDLEYLTYFIKEVLRLDGPIPKGFT